MTSDKNFRMKKSTKAMLALGKFRDAHDRGAFKRMMIDAQLAEESAARTPIKFGDAPEKGRSRGAVAPE